MSSLEFIYFGCVGKSSIRLGKNIITKERLKELTQVKDPVLVDQEGNEWEMGLPSEEKYNTDPQTGQLLSWIKDLDPNIRYNVYSEEDLDAHSEEDDSLEAQIERANKLTARQEAMERVRRKLVKDLYIPVHPYLTTLTEDMLLPSFLKAIKSESTENILNLFHQETSTGIYSFSMFTQKFCSELIEEVENFEKSGLPVARPNSMNNYGVILEEIGFKQFFQQLLKEYVNKFAPLLYGQLGSNLDDHHTFIVQYKIGEDLDLDFHYDDSEVTLNICLGQNFIGGELYFRGLLEDELSHSENFEFQHQPGKGIVHVGRHRHGAQKIKSGERYNLIVWCRSTKLRQQTCSHCGLHNHQHDNDM